MGMTWEPREIVLKVRDLVSTRSFYKAVLSMGLIDEEPGYSATFELGPLRLVLEKDELEELPERYGHATRIVLGVRSLTDLVESMNKLNAEYMIEDLGDRKRLDIADPEGHRITIMSKY